jgi:hypothetical protein
VQEGINLKRGDDGYLLVPMEWVPENAIQEFHARDALTAFGLQKKPETIEAMIKQMKDVKKEVKNYARAKIEHEMYLNAKKHNITYGVENKPVKNIRDLIVAYKEANTKEKLKDMWYVVRGYIDQDTMYFRKMADEFMDINKWRYKKQESDSNLIDGFVKKLMGSMNREIHRRFANNGKDIHQTGLKIKRPPHLIAPETKYRKRQKGVFEWYMVLPQEVCT